jgi:hypothetical protein
VFEFLDIIIDASDIAHQIVYTNSLAYIKNIFRVYHFLLLPFINAEADPDNYVFSMFMQLKILCDNDDNTLQRNHQALLLFLLYSERDQTTSGTWEGGAFILRYHIR